MDIIVSIKVQVKEKKETQIVLLVLRYKVTIKVKNTLVLKQLVLINKNFYTCKE